MSIALIEESAKEVRRLAIAGSSLAVGDFRLKKLIPPLEQAGAKVPVFGQVAKAISDVVNGNEAESAARLLNLSTLLNAILYTQGQSSVDGEIRDLEMFATECSTAKTSARILKPLVEALTLPGGGRFEVIKSACERGVFKDLRLIGPAIQALGDNYPEIADLVAETILPGYGPGIMPLLKDSFDLKGKKHDARKLTVMHRIDPAGTLPLCKTALEDGSLDVKLAAVACLGKHEDCLPLVLEQTKAKNKQIRAAALEALAQHDRPEITNLFTELLQEKTLDVLIGPFKYLRNTIVLKSLLEEGNKTFAQVLRPDEEEIGRFAEILECLKGHHEVEVEEFLINCLAQCEKLSKIKAPKNSKVLVYISGSDLTDRLSWMLYEIGSPRALDAVISRRDALPPSAFNQVLQSALRLWTPEKVFQEFSPLLEQRKGPGKDRCDILQQTIKANCGDHLFEFENAAEQTAKATVQWDARWLDAAIKEDHPLIVCCLAKPGHKGAANYLRKAVGAKGPVSTGLLIRALARCQHPEASDVFLIEVEKRAKGARYLDYELQTLLKSARFLPATDLPKLDAFAGKLEDKFIDPFLEAIAPLRATPQPN